MVSVSEMIKLSVSDSISKFQNNYLEQESQFKTFFPSTISQLLPSQMKHI